MSRSKVLSLAAIGIGAAFIGAAVFSSPPAGALSCEEDLHEVISYEVVEVRVDGVVVDTADYGSAAEATGSWPGGVRLEIELAEPASTSRFEFGPVAASDGGAP